MSDQRSTSMFPGTVPLTMEITKQSNVGLLQQLTSKKVTLLDQIYNISGVKKLLIFLGTDYIEGDNEEAFWADIDHSVNVEDFLRKWRANRPRDFWLNRDRLEKAAELHFNRRSPSPIKDIFTDFLS